MYVCLYIDVSRYVYKSHPEQIYLDYKWKENSTDSHYVIINLFWPHQVVFFFTKWKMERDPQTLLISKKKKKKQKKKKKPQKTKKKRQPIRTGRTWKGTGLKIVVILMSWILILVSYFSLSLFTVFFYPRVFSYVFIHVFFNTFFLSSCFFMFSYLTFFVLRKYHFICTFLYSYLI